MKALHETPHLLRIDHEAALAKLVSSQLQGTWQLPAELARLAIAAGARSVDLEIAPRRLALTAPGARLERRTVGDFATVLDREQKAGRRHHAMVELEEQDAFALAALAGLEVKALEMRIGGEAGLKLEVASGGELRVGNPAALTDRPGDLRLVAVFEGAAIEAARAEQWLRRVGRFAGVPIAVNGYPIDHGFDEPLARERLSVPRPEPGRAGGQQWPAEPDAALPVELAIPRRGSAPRLWLLRHGIISTRATVPGFPAFEAAVEMAPVAGPETSAAMLRERLGPYTEALVDAAVSLTLRLARGAATLAEETRARTARLLLEAALKRRRRSEVAAVEIFPLAGAGGRRLVHVDEISRRVRVERGGTCTLDAVPPGRDPRDFSLAGRPALVISQPERVLLGELLQVVFSAPPARIRRPLGRRLMDLATRRTLGFGRGSAVAESELSDAERGFLSQVRTALAARGGVAPPVVFRRGGGRLRRAADGTLLVPRRDPTVRASVRAVGRDPAWIYPAVAFLLGGRELPGPEVRRLWSARQGGD